MPGFRHEVFASWHPLFTCSAGLRGAEATSWTAAGVEYLNTDLPPAPLPGRLEPPSSPPTLDANVAEPRCGEAWRGDVRRVHGQRRHRVRRPRHRALVGRGPRRSRRRPTGSSAAAGCSSSAARCSTSARDWLTETFPSERAHGLLAPWVLHTGLGPDQASSGFMCQVIAVRAPARRDAGAARRRLACSSTRSPGSSATRAARRGPRPRSSGSSSRTAGATGVRLAGGETVAAERAVIACVDADQLYDRLLAEGDVAGRAAEAARRFRFGRARDADPLRALASGPTGRATSGSSGRRSSTSRPGSTASRARSTRPTAACCRPRRRSRRPADGGRSVARARGRVDPLAPAPGAAVAPGRATRPASSTWATARWTEELREAYADRIRRGSRGTSRTSTSATLARASSSPADIEAANPNFVGGDIYCGALLARPEPRLAAAPSLPGHRTAVEELWHIGASTHPGPGLGAGSGYLVAKRAAAAAAADAPFGRLSRSSRSAR